jgi:hypothetical protein
MKPSKGEDRDLGKRLDPTMPEAVIPLDFFLRYVSQEMLWCNFFVFFSCLQLVLNWISRICNPES